MTQRCAPSGVVGRIAQVSTRAANLLENTSLDISPVAAMQNYQRTTYVMTIMLYVFSIPILALVLYFVGLISGLVVARQEGEVAILKSRGTGVLQVLGIYTLEGVLIGLVALALGLPLGRQLAILMGNTVSLSTWEFARRCNGDYTEATIGTGVVVAVLASGAPEGARMSVVTYHQGVPAPSGDSPGSGSG